MDSVAEVLRKERRKTPGNKNQVDSAVEVMREVTSKAPESEK